MIAIAIDGPAGAGKSTIARLTAKQLGFIYVDTGAFYRAVGLAAMKSAVNIDDEAALDRFLSGLTIEPAFRDGVQRVILNGEDVSEAIRTPKASEMASLVSAKPAVRSFLLGLQKGMAEKYNVIMDGRDIGTVILPNAQVKIFLTASPEVRAERRYRELTAKQTPCDYETILAEIKERDFRDSSRAIAPLKAAADAVTVDTSDKNINEVVDELLRIIRSKVAL